MTSLLDKFNEIQKLECYIKSILGGKNEKYVNCKEYRKEFNNAEIFCREYYKCKKRKNYNCKSLRQAFMVFPDTDEKMRWKKAFNLFLEDYLPDIRKKYHISEEKYIELENKLKEMKKQYEIDKLEQELQKAEERRKIMNEKKAVNKANRLKKQNDIKTFCECCNKEYIARAFKTHLESEKHKKNETKFNA